MAAVALVLSPAADEAAAAAALRRTGAGAGAAAAAAAVVTGAQSWRPDTQNLEKKEIDVLNKLQ